MVPQSVNGLPLGRGGRKATTYYSMRRMLAPFARCVVGRSGCPGVPETNPPKSTKYFENCGERGRARTFDPCLKRALLYQLSYAPHLCNQALAEIAWVHSGPSGFLSTGTASAWVQLFPIIAITLRCASRFTGMRPCVYVSSVTLLSA